MKKSGWFWMTMVGILWLALYFCFLIKWPFYIYMNRLHLPEECIGLETNVIVTDLAYGWHIEAERLIYSDRGEKAVESYINKHNRFSKGIVVRNFYESNGNVDYDHDILIPSEKYPYQEQDAENYMLCHYSSASTTEWGNFYNLMFHAMFWLGIILMAVLCRITYRISLHLHKNNPVYTSQELAEDGEQYAYLNFYKQDWDKK